jgi:hypothetical protein
MILQYEIKKYFLRYWYAAVIAMFIPPALPDHSPAKLFGSPNALLPIFSASCSLSLRYFQSKGKIKCTRWISKFDILSLGGCILLAPSQIIPGVVCWTIVKLVSSRF